MAVFRVHKVVSTLPGTLDANAIYLLRVGSGFDLYVSDSTGTLAHKINGLSSAEISIPRIGASTLATLADLKKHVLSAGHLGGGAITDGGGGNVSVAAGYGLIRATDDDTSEVFVFDWPSNSLAIPAGTVRYVYVDYNVGSPVVAVSASESYDYRTSFPLGFVSNEAGTLYINDTPHSTGRAVGRLARRNYEVEGRSRAHSIGGLILGSPSGLKVSVSAGVTWLRGVRESFAGLDTAVTGGFDAYHRDGGGGWTRVAAATDLLPNLYDNGTGTLAAVGTNNWSNKWVYLGPSGGIVLVHGQAIYNKQADAISLAGPPVVLPPRIQIGSILLGRFVMKNGDTTPSLIQSAFNTSFVGSLTNDHADLSNLQGGSAGQYNHLTNTELSKLGGIAPGATANASDAALRDRATHTGTQTAETISDLAAAVAANAAVTANTAKVTNANHTGDATGDTALTIANNVVSNAKLADMATATLKGRVTGGTGDPEDLTPAQGRTVLQLPKITVGTVAPSSPATGDLWVDTN